MVVNKLWFVKFINFACLTVTGTGGTAPNLPLTYAALATFLGIDRDGSGQHKRDGVCTHSPLAVEMAHVPES